MGIYICATNGKQSIQISKTFGSVFYKLWTNISNRILSTNSSTQQQKSVSKFFLA